MVRLLLAARSMSSIADAIIVSPWRSLVVEEATPWRRILPSADRLALSKPVKILNSVPIPIVSMLLFASGIFRLLRASTRSQRLDILVEAVCGDVPAQLRHVLPALCPELPPGSWTQIEPLDGLTERWNIGEPDILSGRNSDQPLRFDQDAT